MSVVFERLQELGAGDLKIQILEADGTPVNPAEITYTVVYHEPGNPHGMVMPPANRSPQNTAAGTFYADLQIPQGYPYGEYEIQWQWRLSLASPLKLTVEKFQVVAKASRLPATFTIPGSGDGETADPELFLVYWGVEELPSTYSGTFITSLDNYDYTSTKVRDITVTAAGSEYIYYCLPVSLGTPDFTVGPFFGGFSLVATAMVNSIAYQIWRSDNLGLGNVTVAIS